MLEGHGYTVDFAHSGAEGISICQDITYDVVAIDYEIPDVSSVEVARKILADNPNLTLLIITGNNNEGLAGDLFSHGIIDHVTKDNEKRYFEFIPSLIAHLLERQNRRRLQIEAESARLESEFEFRSVLDNSRDLLYKFNLKTGTYDYMSPSIEKILGISADDYMAGGIELAISLLHPDDVANLQEHIDHLLDEKVEEDMAPTLEYRFKHPKLGYRWFSDNRTVIYDEDNNAVAIVGNSRDITEQKMAEDALKNNEHRFRDFANVASDWFWEMGPDLQFTYLSERYYEITGYRPEDMVGAARGKFIDPTDLAANKDKWNAHFEALEYHEPFRDLEFAFKVKDGGVRHARISGMPVFAANDEFAGYRGTGTDITAGKEADNALRDSESNFRDLVESSLQGVSVLDQSQRYFANRAYAEMLGYDSVEDFMQSAKAINVFAPYERQRVRDRLSSRLASGGQAEPFEADMVRKDGSTIAVLIMGKRVKWYGKPAVLSTFVDITQRKSAEDALKKSEERFRALIENALDIITILSPDGTIVFESPSVERVLDYKPEELVGRSVLEFLHPDEVPRALEALQHTLENPSSLSEIELRFRHKDGSWRHLQAIGRNLLEHPSVGGIILNSRDVTESLHLEEQLNQAQKMEAVGQLTGGVAHDFNNLLAVIMGNLELLIEETERAGKISGLATRALAATQRGADLTHRLLAFSRKQPLSPVAANANNLIAGLEDMLRRTLGETIDLTVKGTPDNWPVMIDPHQFDDALLNLAINARDAMSNGGKLVIETANIALDEAYAMQQQEVTPGDYIEVAVSDTGTGMPPETLDKVFEPFFTTKEVGKGSGLGLSMVYGFVKQSKGHVTIYSEVGHGTTVKLYLPRSMEAAVQQDTKVETLTHGRGSECILVVEDDPSVREISVNILRDQGYEVVEASDGVAAIELLKGGRPFDLLFSDIVLPGGLNGVEIAEEAKRIQPSIKVLYTTGYAENAFALQSQLDPAATLVSKPYRRVELLKKVRAILENSDAESNA